MLYKSFFFHKQMYCKICETCTEHNISTLNFIKMDINGFHIHYNIAIYEGFMKFNFMCDMMLLMFIGTIEYEGILL